MKQAKAFRYGEGDAWYERNRDAKLNDLVLNATLDLGIKPASMLEVGCGNGRYLAELHKRFGGRCLGIDPSPKAIREARNSYPDIRFKVEDAAEGLNFEVGAGNNYDLITFGFCLYLVDREDLFFIVAASDAILNDGGHIVIHDFNELTPKKIPYHHKEGIFTYKMRYPNLWVSNQAYEIISRSKINDGEWVHIIKKVGWQ